MIAIIIRSDLEEVGKTLSFHLENGETALNRQISILNNCGIKDFVIIDKKECDFEIKDSLLANNIIFMKTIEEIYDQVNIEDDVILLKENIVFSQDLIKSMLQKKMLCYTLISKDTSIVGENFAQVDMKSIVDIGKDKGLACYPHFPIYIFRKEKFESLISKIKDMNMPFIDALSKVAIDLKLQYHDCSDQPYIAIVDLHNLEVVSQQIRFWDITKQEVFKGEACIVELEKFSKKNLMKKPFIIYDDLSSFSSISDYLDYLKIDYVSSEISSEILYDDFIEYTKLFNDENCDSIISIGSGSATNVAKTVKAFTNLSINSDYFVPQIDPNDILHIVIPNFYQTGDESTSFINLFRDDKLYFIKHESLLPQVVFLDQVFITRPALISKTKRIKLEQVKEHIDEDDNVQNEILSISFTRLKQLLSNEMIEEKIPQNRSEVLHLLGKIVNVLSDDISLTMGSAMSQVLGVSFIAATSLFLLPLRSSEGNIEKFKKTLIGLKDKADISKIITSIYLYIENLKTSEMSDERIAEMSIKASAETEFLTYQESLDLFDHILKYKIFNSNYSSKKKQKQNKLKVFIKTIFVIVKKTLKRILKILPPVYKVFAFFIRRCYFGYYHFRFGVNYRSVVFESFAGLGYRCNPKAIYEGMLDDGAYNDFKFIWAVKNTNKFKYLKQNPNTKVIKRGSKAYIKACATSKYWITNYSLPKYLKPTREHVYVQTWHGKPLKRIGCDFFGEFLGRRTRKTIIKDYSRNGKRFSFLISPAPIFSEKMASAYNLSNNDKKEKIIETGYPRNDFLFEFSQIDVLKIKIKLRVPLNKKILLYAPTWRQENYNDDNNEFVFTPKLDFANLIANLGEEYLVLFRAHDHEAKSVDFLQFRNSIIDVTHIEDINELYIISDLLITDYSGAIFDYANLCRPIILYMYDRLKYEKSPGFYFDVDLFPMKTVYEQECLVPAVRNLLEEIKFDDKYKQFNLIYNQLDSANCTMDTLDKIIDVFAHPTKSANRLVRIRKIKKTIIVKVGGFFRKTGVWRSKNSKKLAAYKNIHKGKRCFLIGNGPSLTISDLNKLQNEICIACNMIYKVYNDTKWRPTYYCLSDTVFAKNSEDIVANVDVDWFLSRTVYDSMPIIPKKSVYVNNLRLEPKKVNINLLDYFCPSFATVMSFMIELAMFMGFSEIYLLGVDCTNAHSGKGHFVDNYRDKVFDIKELRRARRVVDGKPMSIEEFGEWMVERSQNVYCLLRKYADEHGYSIYNATRGGELRAFERADLDMVLKKEKINS